MTPRFQADADFNQKIVPGVRRREPAVDFQSAELGGMIGVPDAECWSEPPPSAESWCPTTEERCWRILFRSDLIDFDRRGITPVTRFSKSGGVSEITRPQAGCGKNGAFTIPRNRLAFGLEQLNELRYGHSGGPDS